MFNVVLVEPEIPPNTGTVGRLCLATGSRLHLVKPLGFSIDDRQLRRAGLDYWHEVDVVVWNSFAEIQTANAIAGRFFYLTTKCNRPYYDMNYSRNDFLVFGRETKGLPDSLLEAHSRDLLTIPMVGTRSLNLAASVAIVLFEGMRQLAGVKAQGFPAPRSGGVPSSQ